MYWLLHGYFFWTNYSVSWNSAVFSSIPIYEYRTAIATQNYSTGPPWNTSIPAVNQLFFDSQQFEQLDNLACIERYLVSFGNVKDIVVVTNTTSSLDEEIFTGETILYNGSSLLNTFMNPPGASQWDIQEWWICTGVHQMMGNNQ